MTDPKSKTVEELRETVESWHFTPPRDVLYGAREAFEELARRLEEAQKDLNNEKNWHKILGPCPQKLLDALELGEAHDAEVAAKAKSEALEFAAEIADDGIFSSNHGNDLYTRQNLASRYRQEAAEYRAKAKGDVYGTET